MPPDDERILIVAPTGQDAALICEQFAAAGLMGVVYHTIEELAGAVVDGAATCLIAEEALDDDSVPRLLEALGSQPGWSDLPLVVLAEGNLDGNTGENELVGRLAHAANVTLLER